LLCLAPPLRLLARLKHPLLSTHVYAPLTQKPQVMEAKFKHKADGGDAKAKAQLDSWQAKATAAEAKLLKTQVSASTAIRD